MANGFLCSLPNIRTSPIFYSLFATHYSLRCSRWNYGGVEIVRKV
jgi:hypothetical protein